MYLTCCDFLSVPFPLFLFVCFYLLSPNDHRSRKHSTVMCMYAILAMQLDRWGASVRARKTVQTRWPKFLCVHAALCRLACADECESEADCADKMA